MITNKGHVKIYGYKGSICPSCGRFVELEDLYSVYYARTLIAEPFRTVINWDEYKVTGLCQDCQDAMFGVVD